VIASTASAQQPQLYVDASRDPNGPPIDGLSWPSAFPNPESAFLLMNLNPNAFTEVWVAEGLYKPQGGTNASTFLVPNGVGFYGGFRSGDPGKQSRTGSARATILSGEVGQPVVSDNTRHVVTIGEGPAETTVDGFTIVDGNARVGNGGFGGAGNGPIDTVGGGILCRNSDLRVNGCYIRDNLADRGAGIYVGRADTMMGSASMGGVRIHGCIFENNFARTTGGAIHLAEYGIPTFPSPGFTVDEPSWIMDCFFTRNSAGRQQADDVLIAAQGGGAIYFDQRNERVLTGPKQDLNMFVFNCRFMNNSVRGRGAACFLSETGTAGGQHCFLNCTMAFNFVLQTDVFATSQGGGGTIWVASLQPDLTSTSDLRLNHMRNTIVYNTLAAGGVPAVGDAITGPGSNSTRPQTTAPLSGLLAINSDIELVLAPAGDVYGQQVNGAGQVVGTQGTIDEDPVFFDAAIPRDLRLQSSSPCKDTGLNDSAPLLTWVPDWFDVDGVASTPANNDPYPRELFGSRARIVNTIIDMGCHEYQTGE
jgi:hypothetical protein